MHGQPVFDLTLYLVVGSDAVRGRAVTDVVAAAVRGGVTLVQLREKTLPDVDVIASARALVDLLAPMGVPLIVNDRVEVAIAAGAAGVHLGQDDIGAARARALFGPDGIIGVSAGNATEAATVSASLSDYVGVGSVYPTTSKTDAGAAIGIAGLRALQARLPLPVVAIGGIHAGNVAEVAATGVAGVAVVSAICGADNPEGAARSLRQAITEGRGA
ncbi:MAG: thiamine phosphate synthase [Alphaproteobacteria bacterium]